MRESPGGALQIAVRTIPTGLAACFLAACGLLMDEGLPSPDCAETRFEPTPGLSCEVAVRAAVDSLASSSPITALSFRYGSLCPPNARCLAKSGNAGTVIVTFADASQVSVFGFLDAGQPHAKAAQAYPPADWDL